MRTVTYQSVLEKACLLWTGNKSPGVDEASELNVYINRRAREAWQAAWWREWMATEARYFRPVWSKGTIYAQTSREALVEVYYPATGKYYQSVVADNNTQPAVENGQSLVVTYEKSNVGGLLTVVYTGLVPLRKYFWVPGANEGAVTETHLGAAIHFAPDGSFTNASDSITVTCIEGATQYTGALYLAGMAWAECQPEYSGETWEPDFVYAAGAIVKNPEDEEYYICAQPNLPFRGVWTTMDPLKWSLLVPFVRSIDPVQAGQTEIGEAQRAWTSNPALHGGASWVDWEWINGRIVVRGCGSRVWLAFRKQVPSWMGETIDVSWLTVDAPALKIYAAGDQVYDPQTGDYYQRTTAPMPVVPGGTLPPAVSNPAYWTRLSFPWILAEVVAQGAYADALRADGRAELFAQENAEAGRLLMEALNENELRGGSRQHLNVKH